jgi:hypothetical protein
MNIWGIVTARYDVPVVTVFWNVSCIHSTNAQHGLGMWICQHVSDSLSSVTMTVQQVSTACEQSGGQQIHGSTANLL